MKRKENKPIDQIPVPVGIGSCSHPSKFKLSNKRTSVEIQEKRRFKQDLSLCCAMGIVSDRFVELFKSMPFRDIEKHKYVGYRDIMDLKKLYFKGWLLSR